MILPILRWPSHVGGATALLLAAAGSHAEPQQVPPQTVTMLAYPAAFATYKGYTEQPVMSWREANDTVGNIGGWRVYAREAAQEMQPAASAATASTPAPVSQEDGHSAHHGGQP